MTALQSRLRSVDKLPTISVGKPWGVERLPAPFVAKDGEKTGEIWFNPPTDCPLLAKFIFTSERLSIQVHPDDVQAREVGEPNGKEECWLILGAEPGATLGIGTVRSMAPDELRDAAISGMLENMMQWHPVKPCMFFHIPPGTVHAIGAGIWLAEIQQKSDITYRLYDYGRPRELHLDKGVEVALPRPMPVNDQRVDPARSSLLLSGASLSVAHIAGTDIEPLREAPDALLLLPIAGHVSAAGERAGVGECLWGVRPSDVKAQPGARFLAAWGEQSLIR